MSWFARLQQLVQTLRRPRDLPVEPYLRSRTGAFPEPR